VNKLPRTKTPVLKHRPNSTRKSQPARAISAANRVVAEVRESLLANRFEAGDFLGTEATLAEYFGIGRSPMRDALRSLEAVGIIEIRVGLGGGVYVAQGNPDMFAEVMAIQLILMGSTLKELLYAIWAVEGMAVDLAIDHGTEADLDAFFEVLGDLQALLDKPGKFVRRSVDFHAAIVAASHSRVLIAQAQMLRHILFAHYSTVLTPQAAQNVFASLAKLAQALRARDRAGAHAQLVAHYNQAREFLLQSEA
jgi:GntR family transcriptional repressor for pyruvate dehydrogenase complex